MRRRAPPDLRMSAGPSAGSSSSNGSSTERERWRPGVDLDESLSISLDESLDLQPPPLSHQGRNGACASHLFEADESPLRWRSLTLDVDDDECILSPPPVYRSATIGSDPDSEDMPLYRSISLFEPAPSHRPRWQRNSASPSSTTAPAGLLPVPASCGFGPASELHWEAVHGEAVQYRSLAWEPAPELVHVRSPLCSTPLPAAATSPPKRCTFELPGDLFDSVLILLPASPDLFSAMAVCRAWRGMARANYLARVVTVPPAPDALLSVVAQARAGDTVRLAPGNRPNPGASPKPAPAPSHNSIR